MAAALIKRLDQYTGSVGDAKAEIFHRISRQLDAHDDLWDSFARHLGLDEEFIAENYLFANGGGSPSRRFMIALLNWRPDMEVVHFQGLLIKNGMEDIASLLDEENANDFMDRINWRTEERVCILLNTPKENPRWKIVAERYGFSKSDIDNFESAMRMFNLYSPTSRILTVYRQRFPCDNFDKIRNFVNNLL